MGGLGQKHVPVTPRSCPTNFSLAPPVTRDAGGVIQLGRTRGLSWRYLRSSFDDRGPGSNQSNLSLL